MSALEGVAGTDARDGSAAAAAPLSASPFTLVGDAAPVCVDGVCELPAARGPRVPYAAAPAADTPQHG